jgi:tRNA modification GTPase
MTDPAAVSTVSILTPPGAGAIACVAVAGPRSWEAVRKYFRPASGSRLPEAAPPRRFWFGTFGREGTAGDEVILSAKADSLELHCHGGVRVVRWIVGLFLEEGFVERRSHADADSPWGLLRNATTARTASVLLDQCRGAFQRVVERILAAWPTSANETERLAALAPVGRHLVEPWRVVIAGRPNVGKSSLLNALAGYTRSIVAPVKGTTRDVVTAAVAFDGWPVELSDTAGLHPTADELESAGIAKAREQLQRADAIVWVMDATEEAPEEPQAGFDSARRIEVWNKCDLAPPRPDGLAVSAHTRAGVPGLIAAIVSKLVPCEPQPLEGVPHNHRLADLVELAWESVRNGNLDTARATLAACLAEGGTDPDSAPVA